MSVRKGQKLTVFQNKIVMRIFGPQWDEAVTGSRENTCSYKITWVLFPVHVLN